ncbi:hypothetical protein NQ317_018986 [Molorchus minor]|uniref:beta-N-acetylhexosaminidase n=1 Tax=Molorchus minor TaxID=1323400 RepID=A0ABQ9JE83_9CUCU|nr:hypothetical protein NQ317_018986 [Molorchus minor]
MKKAIALVWPHWKFATVSDKPVYPHRGLLLDSARNYLTLDVIKKNIDGMAASKMNVLHWHITDTQSFPLEVPSLPNMTKYGAYGENKVYKPEDVEDLVQYAKIRGVRLLIEIDGPSHAGSGWQWGPEAGLGNLAVCINQQPWRSFCIQPPCGQLNPANPNMYKVLNTLYKDISKMVPDSELFHMGGDEVNLWGQYHTKALAAYDLAVGHNRTSAVVWTSHLTDPDLIQQYFDKNRIAGIWTTDSGGSTTFYTWRNVYENQMYQSSHPLILGGEVCMWGELVDDNNIEPRIWPRAAAAAERLWTNPTTKSSEAETRFFVHRERLLNRGIRAEAEIPGWCVQNDGGCSSYL